LDKFVIQYEVKSDVKGGIILSSITRNILIRRIQAAQGLIPGDTVIKNCHIIDVYSQSIRDGDICMIDGSIAAVGGSYEARTVIDGTGLYAAPGLIDSHIHVESSYVSPEELGRLIVPLGTTTIVADPHEIVNVCGLQGLQYMIDAAKNTALDIRYMMPSCVPATPFDHAGAAITANDMREPLGGDDIVGLGEFMNCPGVTSCQPEVLDKLVAAHEADKPIDGHSPGLSGQALQAYIATGIQTDHECATIDEAKEKLALGMYILLRNGSACHDLPHLIGAVTPQTLRRFLLCSDDLHPKTILSQGHLNAHLRLCVEAGLSPQAAITMATLNAAECYGFRDRGALAPGKRADIVLFEDVQDFHVVKTFIAGREVASQGNYLLPVTRADFSSVGSSVHIADFSVEKLKLHLTQPEVYTIDILPGGVVTHKGTATVQIDENGDFIYSPDADIVKTAVVERHHGTGNVGVGLLRGYGLTRGAVAVSIAHDSHNIIVAGANNEDMAKAVDTLAELKGGMAIVLDGNVLASMPLPIAGLMSDQSGVWVDRQMEDIYEKAYTMLGIHRDVDVIMTLCFMSLPVIPAIKLLDTGLFDVEKFDFMDIEVKR
jgi:adenine deaminase